jgi:Trk K+ transport system NAD-binding subunit
LERSAKRTRNSQDGGGEHVEQARWAAALDRVHIGRETVHVQGESYSLARLQVETGAALVGQSLAALNAEPGLTVLLHRRDGQIAIPPDLAAHLRPRDEIVTLASAEALRHLHTRNKAATTRSAR